MTHNSRTLSTFSPPVMAARAWMKGRSFPEDRPLLNVSQAAPVDPPPMGLRQAMAQAALEDDSAHLYGDVLGMSALRTALSGRTNTIYGAQTTGDNVAITSGCNQAFAAAIAALCSEGDEVILPTPWYFNHKMWLDMSGVTAVPLPTGAQMLPDPNEAATRITSRTRAIALVSPNNPAGVEYPPSLLKAFFDLAQAHGIKLILDETYRDFHSQSGAPHDLFQAPDWADTLVQLYSFSKSYRLTGHRMGAMISGTPLLSEAEKFLDTVTICPSQLGQQGALWGLNHMADWLLDERAEILHRRGAIETGFQALAGKGWRLKGAGAYFAYLEHPFSMPSDQLALSLLDHQSVLCLPGTMFTPLGDPEGKKHLRLAFANLDSQGIQTLYKRLERFTP
jgi:aspartate/methionine/tyrosine aminotransferase